MPFVVHTETRRCHGSLGDFVRWQQPRTLLSKTESCANRYRSGTWVSHYTCVTGSAGFCCSGLGKGRPFPHVKAWGGTAQITTQGHRGTFFRVVFRYLAIAALSLSGPLDHGKTTLMRRSLITRWGGPRSETTQLTSEVDRFLTGKSPKCLRL